MDAKQKALLNQHGAKNLLLAMTDQQCEDMLQSLEEQLAQEEKLLQNARQLRTSQPEDTAQRASRTTPPYSLPSISSYPHHAITDECIPASSSGGAVQVALTQTTWYEPSQPSIEAPKAPQKPKRRSIWSKPPTWIACTVMLFITWSAGLYRYAYQQGQQQVLTSLQYKQQTQPRVAPKPRAPMTRPVTRLAQVNVKKRAVKKDKTELAKPNQGLFATQKLSFQEVTLSKFEKQERPLWARTWFQPKMAWSTHYSFLNKSAKPLAFPTSKTPISLALQAPSENPVWSSSHFLTNAALQHRPETLLSPY